MKQSLIFLLIFFFSYFLYSQSSYRIMCYNVENLFDCKNDSLTNDDEFTPTGRRGWNYEKYNKKLARIAKVIAAVGEGTPPMIVGLCEIENEKVLNDLTKYSPLRNFTYQFKHFESPDKRGVDVGLLYQKTIFRPLFSEPVRVISGRDPNWTTRDILYVSGVVMGTDTLHLFVCHFPSRLGGVAESEYKRCDAASILKEKTDSIFKTNFSAKIVIMGDFNDYPDNKSLFEILGAKPPEEKIENNKLYNLFYQFHEQVNIGSHKHESEWGTLDQIIVSGSLLQTGNGLHTSEKEAHIFDAEFLLENDANFFYQKPFRTYVGFKYNNGFSDHLPIYINLTESPHEF